MEMRWNDSHPLVLNYLILKTSGFGKKGILFMIFASRLCTPKWLKLANRIHI